MEIYYNIWFHKCETGFVEMVVQPQMRQENMATTLYKYIS